ncbi:unnamed protein product [Prorocentrum cordatum]|uniref:Subtilisin n=1 Tax=Prorocentrum cordatum TaxID=2364126 RepID=A0ABN9VYV4_9DINO|nr:unnamed protein product [Polarella glacialis]
MAQKAPVRVCLLIPLLVHGVCGTTAALEVNFQQDDTVLLQLGTDATSFDLDRVSSRKGVPTVTSMVLHVNASQQKGQRQVEAADHMVNGASWSQLGQDIDGEAPGDQSGKSVSLSSDGSRVAIGAINNGGAGYSSGHVRVFGLSGNTWSQLGQDIDGEASYDYSGWSVSLSSDGSRVAIGASYNGGAGYWSGHVRVFGLSGNTWSQLGQDIDGEASGDYSGGSVSLSSDGSRVAIGAHLNDGAGYVSGHVRVFGLSGNTWSQLGQDIDGEASYDYSGESVSLSSDGSRVAIGATGNGGAGYRSGHVRVFGLSGNTWSQLGQDIDGEASYDYSGWSVSLSSDGSRVAIGASYNGGAGYRSGHVRVFGLSGNTWSQLGQDIDGEASGDRSGGSVSLSSDGSRVAIGAYFNDGAGSSSGHVRVFGIEAPTPVPSPAPPAMTAAAVGDPHLVNMYGQRFDLLKVGKHLLVEVPQFAAESATLLAVAAVAQRLGDACSDVYFVSLNVTGKWADGVREGGFHYTAKQPQAHRKGTGWLSFHSIQLKTVWGRTGGGISYLNLFVKNLGKSGYPVGGLLGGGDHASVTKPVLRCKRELVL